MRAYDWGLTSNPPPNTNTNTKTGQGRYSSVRGCVKRVDGCPYAVKRLAHRLRNAADRAHCLREAFAWAALADCPKLVRCVIWGELGVYVCVCVCPTDRRMIPPAPANALNQPTVTHQTHIRSPYTYTFHLSPLSSYPPHPKQTTPAPRPHNVPPLATISPIPTPTTHHTNPSQMYRYYDAWVDDGDGHLYLQLEWCQGGSLEVRAPPRCLCLCPCVCGGA